MPWEIAWIPARSSARLRFMNKPILAIIVLLACVATATGQTPLPVRYPPQAGLQIHEHPSRRPVDDESSVDPAEAARLLRMAADLVEARFSLGLAASPMPAQEQLAQGKHTALSAAEVSAGDPAVAAFWRARVRASGRLYKIDSLG